VLRWHAPNKYSTLKTSVLEVVLAKLTPYKNIHLLFNIYFRSVCSIWGDGQRVKLVIEINFWRPEVFFLLPHFLIFLFSLAASCSKLYTQKALF